MKAQATLGWRLALLLLWWIFWLCLSQTPWNVAIRPSVNALVHFILLLGTFALGVLFMRFAHGRVISGEHHRKAQPITPTKTIKLLLYIPTCIASLLLIVSLYRADALSTPFIEYFTKLRVEGENLGNLTGIKLLDTLTKLYAFPASYTVLLATLAIDTPRLRPATVLCLINFGMFSYLWQVNYPIIHVFWLSVFYLLTRHAFSKGLDRRVLAGLTAAGIVLTLSAMNRFGSDDAQLAGAVNHYLIGYHLIGFSFYDFQLADPNSILHIHSFGRSSLGFLDQIVEHVGRIIGSDYVAASSENSNFNDTAVSIGTGVATDFNAFGTLAFSFYRDFGVVGITIGGFIYGAALGYCLLNVSRSWIAAAVFYLLATAWMIGMMVSPVEQTYFWFALVFLATLKLLTHKHHNSLPRSKTNLMPKS
jgi:hypothetical protein